MKNINETLKTDNSKAISLGLVTLILVVLLHFLNLTAYIGLSFPVALFIGAYIGKSQGAIIYSVLVIIQMFIFPGALSESLIRLVVALLTYLIFLTRRVVRQKEWISVSVFQESQVTCLMQLVQIFGLFLLVILGLVIVGGKQILFALLSLFWYLLDCANYVKMYLKRKRILKC